MASYSQQEPTVLTQLCEDKNMIAAVNQGKDLYAQIAATVFHCPYEMCLEHFPKGMPIKQYKNSYWYPCQSNETPDKYADGKTDVYYDGKERRTQAKRILLGEQKLC